METLYRKYRPLDFDTVVGQEAIVKTLRNQINKGSIAHAYLFSGTRGTGKTTIAKIFARAINCPNEKNGNPCNECNTCRAALEGANLNIVELDAASNRSIEDIRRITESILYPPINDEKYKVFIIDEAHALTKDAMAAFLKSLEEPPEYVVYILATTDPNKLSETILSRCQRYNFKRIGVDEVVAYLRKICDEEKIDIDDESLVFIAEKSDGSMRESISKLDRCRSYASDEKFTKEKVLSILGIVDDDDFKNLTKAVNESDIQTAFRIVSESIDKGKDINQFTSDFIWHLRNLLIVKNLNEPVETLNITKNNFNKLKEESELIPRDALIFFIEELSRTLNVMRYDENRRVILETAIIRLSNPESCFLESAVMARVAKMEEDIRNNTARSIINLGNITTSIEKPTENKKSSKENVENENKDDKIYEIKVSKASYEELNKVVENWKTIVAALDRVKRVLIEKGKPYPDKSKDSGLIEIVTNDVMEYEMLKKDNLISETEHDLSEIAKKVIGKEIVFKITNKKDSKYTEKTVIRLEDAYEKIDMEIGLEDDK